MFVSEFFLTELSSWKQHALKGEVSNKGLMKLSKAGVRKPVLAKLAGVEKGAEEKKRKAGAIDTTADIYQTALEKNNKDHTLTGRIITTKPKEKKEQDPTSIIDDHEANEARETRKRLNKGITSPTTLFTKKIPDIDKLKIVGRHVNPKVLKDEYKTRDQLVSQYPHLKNQKAIKAIVDYRKDSGEDDYVRGHTNAQLNRVANKLDKYKLQHQKVIKKYLDDRLIANDNQNVSGRIRRLKPDNHESLLNKADIKSDKKYKKLHDMEKKSENLLDKNSYVKM